MDDNFREPDDHDDRRFNALQGIFFIAAPAGLVMIIGIVVCFYLFTWRVALGVIVGGFLAITFGLERAINRGWLHWL